MVAFTHHTIFSSNFEAVLMVQMKEERVFLILQITEEILSFDKFSIYTPQGFVCHDMKL